MILETEENINKVDWFISKKDYCIYGFYKEFIIYSFNIFENGYIIHYTDRAYTSKQDIKDNLMKKIKQKNLIEYDSVDFFIKFKKREERLNKFLKKI